MENLLGQTVYVRAVFNGRDECDGVLRVLGGCLDVLNGLADFRRIDEGIVEDNLHRLGRHVIEGFAIVHFQMELARCPVNQGALSVLDNLLVLEVLCGLTSDAEVLRLKAGHHTDDALLDLTGYAILVARVDEDVFLNE